MIQSRQEKTQHNIPVTEQLQAIIFPQRILFKYFREISPELPNSILKKPLVNEFTLAYNLLCPCKYTVLNQAKRKIITLLILQHSEFCSKVWHYGPSHTEKNTCFLSSKQPLSGRGSGWSDFSKT